MSLDSLVSSAEFISPVVMFTWNKYPDTVMLKYIGEEAVRSSVEKPVNHAVDKLLNKYYNSVTNAHKIISEIDLESMMGAMAISATRDGIGWTRPQGSTALSGPQRGAWSGSCWTPWTRACPSR